MYICILYREFGHLLGSLLINYEESKRLLAIV